MPIDIEIGIDIMQHAEQRKEALAEHQQLGREADALEDQLIEQAGKRLQAHERKTRQRLEDALDLLFNYRQLIARQLAFREIESGPTGPFLIVKDKAENKLNYFPTVFAFESTAQSPIKEHQFIITLRIEKVAGMGIGVEERLITGMEEYR